MELQVQQLDEIEADVECLMCARVIGQLFGHRWRTGADCRSARIVANLTTYRDNAVGARRRPVSSQDRFHCRQCGGQAFVGEILVRSLMDKVPSDLCPIHIQPKTGPGRPPTGCRCEGSQQAA